MGPRWCRTFHWPGRSGVLKQSPAVWGDEPDCLDEVGEDRHGNEVVEVDADPARFDALAAVAELALEPMGTVQVDAQQAMSVGARARAAATGLDSEEVVEDGTTKLWCR